MSDIVGQIALELNLDSVQFKKSLKNLNRTASKSAESMKNSFSGAFKKIAMAATAAFSAAAVIKFGKDCVESTASVSAANSQLAQTFGELQSNAESAMSRVAKASGIVQTRLQSVGTSIYAFAKTTGMDSANALSMMEEALQVTADSAAYYDRSLEDTAESLKSFLKGNYENDAALGLSCTETTRNAAANKLYGKSFQSLSESQKQLTLLQMVKDANALSGALGQAARESDGWENVIGNLKESWKQFLAVIGQPILQAATAVIKQITSAIQTLTDYAKMASNALGELFGWSGNNAVAMSVSSAADSATALSSSTAESTDNLNNSTKAAEKLKKAVAGFDQLNILSSDSSSANDTSTSDSTANTITPIVDTSTAENSFQKSFDNIKRNVEEVFKNSGIDDFVKELQRGIAEINFAEIGSNFESIMQSLNPIAQASFSSLQKISKSSVKTLGKTVGGISKVVGKSVQTVSGGIANWLEQDNGKIIGYIDTISSNLSGGIDNVGNFVESVTTTAGLSIDRMRPTMENAIAKMLSGITTFSGSIGIIFSGAFNTASGVIAQWAENNKLSLGLFFDNVQSICADSMNGVGTVFQDVGDILTSWWAESGQTMWEGMCKVVTDFGTIFLDIFNTWIMPIWEDFKNTVSDVWENTLRPVFDNLINVISQLWNDIIQPFWDNVLKPLVDWLIGVLAPRVKNAFHTIWSVIQTVFNWIGGVINGAIKTLKGWIEFISGVFTGNWEKAWNGIKDIVTGVWEGIWSAIKGIINLIIDGINAVWGGIYSFAKGVVDSIGGISGAIGKIFGQDWSFNLPDNIPYIPKLAKGGLAKAPTLAMVGDNPNASSDPEVISPLSKLKGMLADTQQTAVCDERIIRLLQRILQAIENQETEYINNTYVDGELIDRKIVKVRKTKNRRYGGALT